MVRADSGADRRYHHGDLRNALVAAGLELARAGGPDAVVLRAATRMAHVAPNAAYRHFANQEDLLAAVAERCMAQLGLLMIERADQVRARGAARRAQARFAAIGRAYVDFARTEPGWFRTAFSSAQPHGDAKSGVRTALASGSDDEQATNPFFILSARLDDLVTAGVLTARRRRGAEYFAWSSVHGLSSLLVNGPLRHAPEPMVEQAIETVLAGVGRGLE